MMKFIEGIFYNLGGCICHQLPERTIMLEGRALPVCARDTGIYIGMFLSIVFLGVTGRWKCDKPPALKYSVVLCILMFLMAADGITSYMGVRETYNFIRMLTGGMFGMAVPLFLIPILYYKIDMPNTQPSVRCWSELAVLIGSLLGICCMIYFGLMNFWWPVSIIVIFTAAFIYFSVAYTILDQFPIRNAYNKIILAFLAEGGFFFIMYLFVHRVGVYLSGG